MSNPVGRQKIKPAVQAADSEITAEEELIQKIRKYKVTKERLKLEDIKLRELQNEIIELMGDYEDETLKSEGVVARVIRPVRTTWNVDQLKEVVSAKPGNLWIKITNRVLDKDKLEAVVKDGALALDEIEDCAEIKPTSPYLKLDISPRRG